MNIFYVSTNPIEAAQSLCDKHVVKMILESAQLLSTAHRILDHFTITTYTPEGKTRQKTEYVLPDKRQHVLYSVTHKNHPCAIWCRSSRENYLWLLYHFAALLNEYEFRYGKKHKCSGDIYKALKDVPFNMKKIDFFDPPSCMDSQYVIGSDVVENYRNYYRLGKVHLHKWKKRSKPTWV